MKTLHEVRMIASLATKDDKTKVIVRLSVKDLELAMAFSKQNVGPGLDELTHAGVKDFVDTWKKYARARKFIFRDETVR